MEYINDFISVYKKAGSETIKTLTKAPILIVLPLIYSVVYGLVFILMTSLSLGAAGRFMGLIVGLIEAAILSGYFSQLEEGISYKRLNLSNFSDGFTDYIFSIYFVRFIFYILSLLLGGILANPYIVLLSFILLNPAGEAIYIRKTTGMDTFLYCIEYLKDNWYLWIPHVILFIVIGRFFLVYPNFNPLDSYLYPIMSINVIRILFAIFMGVYGVFRGVLFRDTRNSTLRKRKYMGINW